MKVKKLKLKKSVKNVIDYALIIAIFKIGIYVSVLSITISSRQTKMTESIAANQSNNWFQKHKNPLDYNIF